MEEEVLRQCFEFPFEELGPLFHEAFESSRRHFSNRIFFYAPGMVHYNAPFYRAVNPYRFPSVSVTGAACNLQCEHCKGRLLETMIPATTPERLMQVCTKIKDEGGKGCLISGGSDRDGGTPIMDFVPVIGWVRKELGLDIVVHTGIVKPEIARALAGAGVEAVMLDIIGSDETIRDVYHLDETVEAFDDSLTLLEENGVPVVPHVVVGLHYGRMEGEMRALRILTRHTLAAAVIVAFMPLEETPMAEVSPASPEEIARVVLGSRLTMPDTPLVLGCARPRGAHKAQTDGLAIKAGVNGIAYPSEEGYRSARELGLEILFSNECCSLIYRDILDSTGKMGG